ncbi:MAG: cytochrome P460 family protein [Candidatus Kapabacteria bacterium]|nr:cytochrome P460 family protein [Candidatus Kapabacteria bacterium]
MKRLAIVLFTIALVTVSVTIQSCSSDTPVTPVTEVIANDASFSGFESFTLESTTQGPSPSLGPAHAGNDSTVTRKIYFKNGQSRVDGKYPLGTVIVKTARNPSGTVKETVAMVKRGNGFNSTSGDWEWFVLAEDGKIAKDPSGMEMRGGAAMMNGMCNGCHAKAQASDFVFSKM